MIKQSTFISRWWYENYICVWGDGAVLIATRINERRNNLASERPVRDGEGAFCVVSFASMLSKLTFQRSRVMLLFFTRSADSHQQVMKSCGPQSRKSHRFTYWHGSRKVLAHSQESVTGKGWEIRGFEGSRNQCSAVVVCSAAGNVPDEITIAYWVGAVCVSRLVTQTERYDYGTVPLKMPGVLMRYDRKQCHFLAESHGNSQGGTCIINMWAHCWTYRTYCTSSPQNTCKPHVHLVVRFLCSVTAKVELRCARPELIHEIQPYGFDINGKYDCEPSAQSSPSLAHFVF